MRKITFIILIAMLTSCGEKITEQQKLAAIEKNKSILAFTCEGYSQYSTPFGDLQNNVWNAHAAEDFDWTQCLAMRTINATTQYGWYWQWPADGEKVYAQPQITLGNSPWLAHNQAKKDFPIAIQQLQSLTIDYSLEIITDGELNLANTFWLTDSDKINLNIDKSSIAAEVMIWTYASEDFYADPAGQYMGDISVGGIDWEVWLDKAWKDTSGKNQNKWIYLAFRTNQQLLNIEFDAAQMLRHAVAEKFIAPDLFIADIQLGTEVMSGTGQLWLDDYNVEIVSFTEPEKPAL